MSETEIRETDEAAGTLSYPLWLLRRAQEHAWANGHARLTARQLRQIRQIQNHELRPVRPRSFFAQIPDNQALNSAKTGNQAAGDNPSAGGPSKTASDANKNQKLVTDGTLNWENDRGDQDKYARKNVPDLNILQPSPGLAAFGRQGRRSRRDPSHLGGVLGRVFKNQGLETFLDEGHLRANWEKMVGPAVAKHTKIERIKDGQVIIRCDSTNWATQLRLLIPQLMAILDRESGSLTIDSLIIKGPDAPSWKHGKRSVRGRGPRDTYG